MVCRADGGGGCRRYCDDEDAGGGGSRRDNGCMAIETAREPETNTLTLKKKPKIVPERSRTSTKIEIVEGGEDREKGSGMIDGQMLAH